MGKAHEGSTLGVKTSLPIDYKNTKFLAHYDVSLNDSLNDIAPIGSTVATLRKFEGKFGGAVAVEEATTNLIANADFSIYETKTNMGWDDSLNGSIYVPGWGSGYNPGVESPNIGHHAHFIIDKNGTPVLEFRDENSQFNASFRHRWLGVSPEITTNPSLIGWADGTNVTVSMDVMTSDVNKFPQFGLYHTPADGSARSFTGTSVNKYLSTPYVWERVSHTYKLVGSDWDFTKPVSLYIYGQYSKNDTEGRVWLKNVQVETKAFATSFVNGTRPTGRLFYNAETVNPLEGTINFWHKSDYENEKLSGIQATSPRLLQVGSYHGNSSFTLWNYANKNGGISLYVKGESSLNWTLNTHSPNQLKNKTWQMITVTWSAKKWDIYIDGALILTGNSSENLSSISGNVILIGDEGATVANALFDEFRIDSVARTEDEILKWYNSQAPFYPKGVHKIYL